MPTTITKKQHELLAFIKAYIEQYGFAPSYPEMRNVFRNEQGKPLSQAALWERLQNLQKAGRVKIEYNKARGIIVL